MPRRLAALQGPRAWRTAPSVITLFAAMALTSCAGGGSTLVISGSGIHTGEHWVDQAALHDGRTAEVWRSISYERNPKYRYDGGYGNSSAFRHHLSVRNPGTGTLVSWDTPLEFNPVAIDFLDGTAYGIIEQGTIYGDLRQFDCPDIPYVFMRLDDRDGKWIELKSADFPPQLLHGNLTPHHHPSMKNGHMNTKEEIAAMYKLRERENGSDARIPADFASWKSKYKKGWRVHHTMDGCGDRIPSNEDPSHPQHMSQAGVPVQLEVLDTQVFDPPRLFKGVDRDFSPEWRAISYDAALRARCRSRLVELGQEADQPELRYWALFKSDPTAKKKVRPESLFWCTDDSLWFHGQSRDRSRIKILKYTNAGDLVYSIEFERPISPGKYQDLGAVLPTTLREEGGYLYFEWWETNQSGYDRIAMRRLKVRFKEPTS